MQFPEVFIDKEYQKSFQSQGICKVQLFSKEEMKTIIDCHALFSKNFKSDKKEFYASVYHKNKTDKLRYSKEMFQLIAQRIQSLLSYHRATFFSFVSKPPHSNSSLNLHQDFSYCDELVYQGLTFWLPLRDSIIENGAVHVVPASNLFSRIPRSWTVPSVYKNVQDILNNYLIPFEVNLGEALIFDNALVHNSPPNFSNDERVAVNGLLLPENSPTYAFFYKNDSSKIEISQFEVLEDYQLRYTNFRSEQEIVPSTASFVKKLTYDKFPVFTPEVIQELLVDIKV